MSRKWSGQDAVATPIVLNVDPRFNDWGVTFKYYTDSTYATEVAPTAGTIAVTCVAYPDDLVATFLGSPVDATSVKEFASLNGNLKQITVTPSAIATATHYKVIVTGTD